MYVIVWISIKLRMHGYNIRTFTYYIYLRILIPYRQNYAQKSLEIPLYRHLLCVGANYYYACLQLPVNKTST